MECEMCSYLEWHLNFEPSTFRDFESHVHHDFLGPGLYPMVVTQTAQLHLHKSRSKQLSEFQLKRLSWAGKVCHSFPFVKYLPVPNTPKPSIHPHPTSHRCIKL